jgi:hypothetical protein
MQMACPLLINTITSMVLISIHPFALRKLFLVVVAFLCFSAFCLADPVLMVRRYARPSERSDKLETSTATLVAPFASSAAFGHETKRTALGFDSLASENASLSAETGGFDRPEANPFRINKPVCVHRSATMSPPRAEDPPSGIGLRKT